MLTERFVIDEAGFAFSDESPAALERAFAAFSDLLRYARSTQQGVAMSSLVWWIESASGVELHEHLNNVKLDRDLRLLLLGQLDKVRCWDDGAELEPPADVTVDGSNVTMAPGVALCALAAIGGRGVACLTTLQAAHRGVHEVALPDGRSGKVSFLVTEDDAPAFWRHLVVLENLDAQAIDVISAWAFPRLLFVPGVWNQVGAFEGSFRDVVRSPLMRDLAGLDDHALAVWKEHIEPSRISAVMAAQAGVDCSRDSPKTHKNAAAMKQRQVKLDGRSIDCEWHTKLERHRNRVHFAVEHEHVVIGIFTNHLAV